ncbi:Spy/CpxP family protein refolding chaperone [Verrucomicrobiota bacterium]
MKRIALITSICTSVAILSMPVFGQGPDGEGHSGRGQEGMRRGPHKGGPGRHIGMMISKIISNPELAEKIGLTEEQIETLKTASVEHQKQLIDLRAEMEKAALYQAELMSAEDLDEDAIMEAIEKTGEIKTKMAKIQVQQLILVKKTLTDEQKAKIKELMQKRMKQHMQDRKREGGPGEKRGEGRESYRNRKPPKEDGEEI